MIIPAFIKTGDTIGVTAPSDGNKKEIDHIRINNAIANLAKKGIKVIETANVRTSDKERSSDKISRSKQFMELWLDKNVAAVISAKGGDFLMEILPYIDFEMVKKNPKWYQGFSDNTGLTFLITTICDIATLYTNNFNDFAMAEWHQAVSDNFNILTGKIDSMKSYDYFQDGFMDYVTGDESYRKDKPVEYSIITDDDEVCVKGRLLGGCLDVLLNLVGTKYDKVNEFVDKYKEDGIIWYLESFSLNSEDLERGLWQLREAGWFDTAKGFVFGREAFFNSFSDTTYAEAVLNQLGALGVPIILGADIGHKPPQFPMINGALATFSCADKKAEIHYHL